jgi:hypothetical protein
MITEILLKNGNAECMSGQMGEVKKRWDAGDSGQIYPWSHPSEKNVSLLKRYCR